MASFYLDKAIWKNKITITTFDGSKEAQTSTRTFNTTWTQIWRHTKFIKLQDIDTTYIYIYNLRKIYNS